MPRKINRNKKSKNPSRIPSRIPLGEMYKKELEALERAMKIVEERRHR
ncbi:hypothetical protein [Brevibacillus borstelensis]